MRMDRALAARIEAATAQFFVKFWDGLAPDPGLDLAPATAVFGGVTCARGYRAGLRFQNRAIGLGLVESAAAESVAAVRQFMAPAREWLFDLCPYAGQAGRVAGLLNEGGLRAALPEQVLVAAPGDVPEPGALPGVTVEPVTAAPAAFATLVLRDGVGCLTGAARGPRDDGRPRHD